ncbi:MAG: TerB family tellurite resistance protein [Desulfobulbaceae bacterium]|nr:TerB family tellurite resistance protein [Desulfobulbaceae bacterium]
MFGVIRKIIEGSKSGKDRESREDPEQKKHIAAGVLLLEAAHVDNECNEEEMEHIVATLQDKFDLPADCVGDLLDLARADRKQSVDLWQFTNYINRNFSPAEKRAVMEDVWRIILLDGKLDKHEDHYAHKLADLLHLTHGQMIAAKLKAREQVSRLS